MTEGRPPAAKVSPSAAKIVLTLASIAGTLGGWLALSAGDSAPTETAPVPTLEPLPRLVEVDPVANGPMPSGSIRPLRRVDPPPTPVTFTRSSR